MRVLLRAAFDAWSGYGNDAIDIARHLTKAGVDVTVWPTSLLPPVPPEFARLLEKDPTGHHDVVMTFAPPFDIKGKDFAKLADKAVGYSMWETSKLTRADMENHGWDMRRREHWWDDLDLMMVTCPMNVEAFAALDPHVRYEVLPCGIDADDWPVVRRDPARRMTFGMIGMLSGRKDPFVLIEAWRELKAEHPEFDAKLELKTLCPGLHPALMNLIPDLTIHDRAWSREQVVDFYHRCDVLVSTSRGEGNDKPIMEMMASGGTVIATDWSAHQNYLHPGVGYPLGGTLAPCTSDPDGPQSFRASKDELKRLLLHTWDHRPEVAEKGRAAASWIRSTLSWEIVVGKMEKTLVSL